MIYSFTQSTKCVFEKGLLTYNNHRVLFYSKGPRIQCPLQSKRIEHFPRNDFCPTDANREDQPIGNVKGPCSYQGLGGLTVG